MPKNNGLGPISKKWLPLFGHAKEQRFGPDLNLWLPLFGHAKEQRFGPDQQKVAHTFRQCYRTMVWARSAKSGSHFSAMPQNHGLGPICDQNLWLPLFGCAREQRLGADPTAVWVRFPDQTDIAYLTPLLPIPFTCRLAACLIGTKDCPARTLR